MKSTDSRAGRSGRIYYHDPYSIYCVFWVMAKAVSMPRRYIIPLGAHVESLRRDLDLTQEDLSGLSGVAPNTICEAETRPDKKERRTVSRLAKALDVPPSCLAVADKVIRKFARAIKSSESSCNWVLEIEPDHLVELVELVVTDMDEPGPLVENLATPRDVVYDDKCVERIRLALGQLFGC